MLLIITGIGDKLLGISNSMTLNDLEPPKLRVLVNFSPFRAAIHILNVNCAEMAEDRSREPAYEIFSIKR